MNIRPDVLIMILIVGLSFLQWAIRKIREQQVINERRRLAQRQMEEALRTGKDPSTVAGTGKATSDAAAARERRQREVAAARQAQLRDLRRQQMEAARAKQQGRTPTPVARPTTARPSTPQRGSASARLPTAGPGSSGTIVPPRPTTRQPTPRPQQATQRKGQPFQPPVERRKTAVPVGPDATSSMMAKSRSQQREGSLTPEPATPTPPPQPQASPPERLRGQPGLGLAGPSDWRRAIMLSEVLGSPLALREPREF